MSIGWRRRNGFRCFCALAGMWMIAVGGCFAADDAPVPASPVDVGAIYRTGVIWEQFTDPYVQKFWSIGLGNWGFDKVIFAPETTKGTFVQSSKDVGGNTIAVVADRNMGDVMVEVKVCIPRELPAVLTASDGDLLDTFRRKMGAGILFRFVDENNYHLFRIAGTDGMVLGKMKDGKWVDLANPRAEQVLKSFFRFSPAKTDWYALRIVAEGSEMSCYISNGPLTLDQWGRPAEKPIDYILVARVRDSDAPLMGKVGLTTFRTNACFAEFVAVEERGLAAAMR